jgi:hypothetical protein
LQHLRHNLATLAPTLVDAFDHQIS